MLKGFRDFITRGNIIDLAVAFVIGLAFVALVEVITANLITPIVNVVLGAGASPEGLVIQLTDDQAINISAIINALITFLITAAVVYFVFVVPMNKYRERLGQSKEEEDAETEIDVLKQIRDDLVALRGGESGSAAKE